MGNCCIFFSFDYIKYGTMKSINWKKIYPVLLGIIALCWFLIRVIPKPSRAAYPCQRAAFPIASAFILWLTSFFTSAFFFMKFRKSLKEYKLAFSVVFVILLGLSILINSFVGPDNTLFAEGASNYSKAYWDENKRIERLENNTISTFDEVAVVQSDEANASDITFGEIEAMVAESVELAGGLSGIVNNGDYVVLKPNLVTLPPTPEPEYAELSGMATDWRVVKAVAKLVRELNPDGKIYIIESSAASSTREIFEFYKYTEENFPEVDQIVALEDSCGAFEDYTDVNLEEIFLDDEVRLYPDEEKPNLSPAFYINKIYSNADVVISIPVLKNHKEAVITGAVKNVAIGMTPPNIYGNTDTYFGKWFKIDHSQENLHKWIHDYFLCKQVDFVVVDGLQGFDHGPVGIDELSMEEMQHNMRLVIAGENALSVDVVCGYIMSLDPHFANYMVFLDNEDYGVGTIDSRFIRMKGERIEDIREVFMHTSEIVTNAIYSDYTPPFIEVSSKILEGNTITFTANSDDDLHKVELEVNGVLLDQVCVADFDTFSFELGDELLPIESMKLLAYDRFYNEILVTFDDLDLAETDVSFAKLDQNFPNPFSNSTTISFVLNKPGTVKLFVSDIHGRMIETIVNEKLQAGSHQVVWQGDVTSGTYIYTLEMKGKRVSKQMLKK